MPFIATDRPLKDAVEQVSRKTPVGSVLSSREWEMVPAEIRMRAMFSARVEHERLLAEMQERLQARIELAKREGRTVDRGVFIEEMREELSKAGYKRGDAKRGSLQDLKSTRRLGLIWDMNIAQAQGYARWKADMTPEGLENEPCYELIRVMDRMERRDWPTIWSQAGGEFFGGQGSNDDYPFSAGRMIAAKNDPVWTRISRFNTPWPPFDWGSGMGLRGIDRDEAEALGVLGPDDEVLPLDMPFNKRTKASLENIPAEGVRKILKALEGEVEIIDGDLHLVPAPKNVPARPVFPVVLQTAFFTAASELASWPEKRLQTLLGLLEKTVAWQRFRASVRAAGGSPQGQDAIARALVQFQSSPDLKAAVREIRNGPLRDAFWSPADFREVEKFLTQGGAA